MLTCAHSDDSSYRRRPNPKHDTRVTGMAFAPDGQWLACCCWDGSVYLCSNNRAPSSVESSAITADAAAADAADAADATDAAAAAFQVSSLPPSSSAPPPSLLPSASSAQASGTPRRRVPSEHYRYAVPKEVVPRAGDPMPHDPTRAGSFPSWDTSGTHLFITRAVPGFEVAEEVSELVVVSVSTRERMVTRVANQKLELSDVDRDVKGSGYVDLGHAMLAMSPVGRGGSGDGSEAGPSNNQTSMFGAAVVTLDRNGRLGLAFPIHDPPDGPLPGAVSHAVLLTSTPYGSLSLVVPLPKNDAYAIASATLQWTATATATETETETETAANADAGTKVGAHRAASGASGSQQSFSIKVPFEEAATLAAADVCLNPDSDRWPRLLVCEQHVTIAYPEVLHVWAWGNPAGAWTSFVNAGLATAYCQTHDVVLAILSHGTVVGWNVAANQQLPPVSLDGFLLESQGRCLIHCVPNAAGASVDDDTSAIVAAGVEIDAAGSGRGAGVDGSSPCTRTCYVMQLAKTLSNAVQVWQLRIVEAAVAFNPPVKHEVKLPWSVGADGTPTWSGASETHLIFESAGDVDGKWLYNLETGGLTLQ